MALLVGAIVLVLLTGSFVQAFAQEPVRGTYRNNAGFQITFPEGWQGELVGGNPVVGPEEPGVLLGVLSVSRTETRELILSEILIGQPANVTGCPAVTNELVMLNGTKVFRTVHECANDPYRKTESYVFFTLTRSFAVSYTADSADKFERHAPAFQAALATVKVDEPVNFRTGLEIILGTTSFFASGIEVQPGNSTNLVVGTTSVLTGVEYEQGDVIVMVDEQRRSQGRLLMPIDTIENDTYTVHVDGEPAQSLVITDREADQQFVLVQYNKGEHEIRISGVEVVPEFPAHVMGVLAAVVAAVILYHRRQSKNVKL
jgi:hypothetical protein